MERSYNERYAYSEHRLNILASVSGASPYIGLFGTVLGVIDAFQGIGISGITSLAAVAPGISEALIATDWSTCSDTCINGVQSLSK